MGDRGNIKVGNVYLYTHWGGSEIKQTLQDVLKRKQRWDDEAYLTRMIFCGMCDDLSGETGFGISTKIQDNEYNILEVDCASQKVKEVTEEGVLVKEWTFAEFIDETIRGE
ncbi:hypothetical protein LCGC14_0852570 [marine sediment metagenome]|uniref:Uncharacterized protein n=1 Tax=marine sediment metagenome TaxID=412755 RepID=A0A0F9PV36_9ZZZZ